MMLYARRAAHGDDGDNRDRPARAAFDVVADAWGITRLDLHPRVLEPMAVATARDPRVNAREILEGARRPVRLSDLALGRSVNRVRITRPPCFAEVRYAHGPDRARMNPLRRDVSRVA